MSAAQAVWWGFLRGVSDAWAWMVTHPALGALVAVGLIVGLLALPHLIDRSG